MKRILATAGIAGLALIGASAPADAGPADKISICHATGSESNPYVEITVSENALHGHNDHAVHENDIIPAPAGGCPGGDHGDSHGEGSKKVTICHATGSETNPYVIITIAESAWLNGHQDGHNGKADIYPVPAGGCVDKDKDHEGPGENPPGEGPGETPPGEGPGEAPEVTPPGEAPGVTPPAVTPSGQVPPGAVVVVPAGAGAAAAPVVNRGFNAQTAAGGHADAGLPAWAGGLVALLAATAAVALRRRGRTQDSPAAN